MTTNLNCVNINSLLHLNTYTTGVMFDPIFLQIRHDEINVLRNSSPCWILYSHKVTPKRQIRQ